MKYPKFSHKTPHLKGKQHQLDPNLDLKQLVHHSTVQYVDRDVDGDVDVYDNPKKKIPDENPTGVDVDTLSKKLIAKQKGEIKHTRRGVAYEEKENGRCKSGYYYCYTDKKCKPIPSGFMVDPEGMLRKENGASIDEGSLHKWFKSSSSKEGKPGWVNVVTGGTCASDEPGEGTPKCVSSAKRASMSPAERRSAARRKKAADPGQQQKTGAAKPTYVSTDKPKKKMNEAKERDHEYSMARSELSTVMNAARRLKKKMGKGEGNIEAWVQSKITKAADYLDSAADYIDSGEHKVEEQKDIKGKGSGSKDACYQKVKSRYSVWPSAYASGALVKCRKVGAANWGTKSEQTEVEEAKKCWPGYEKKGTQKLFGKTYNRCVKKEEAECNHTDSGIECPIHGMSLCKSFPKGGNGGKIGPDKNYVKPMSEAVRIPSKTGNIILVTLTWRGKYYGIKMFFPQVTKPSRKEVQNQIDKVYPGAKVQTYYVSEVKPGEQFLQTEDWQKVNRKDKTDGLSQKAVDAYRRENPGSKLQTAVTEKKPTGKRAERRKSFCRRMKGMKSKLTSAETSRDPDSRINKALRRWNCN